MKIKPLFLLMVLFLVGTDTVWAVEEDYPKYAAGFKNFITCELTRTDAVDHFKGKPFTVTMIRLHEIRRESGMMVLTGAVQCAVDGGYRTLYAALGVEPVAGRETVGYYTIRTQAFHILASELLRFPYMERCPWTQYWIDID